MIVLADQGLYAPWLFRRIVRLGWHPLLDVTAWCPERPRTQRAPRLRLVSVFRQGWVRLPVVLLRHEPLPQGRLELEPWPAVPPLAGDPYAPEVVLLEAA